MARARSAAKEIIAASDMDVVVAMAREHTANRVASSRVRAEHKT
jgi:hypothetical protein